MINDNLRDENLEEAINNAWCSPARPNNHIGASWGGQPCDRYIWLKYRNALVENFDGRMFRLFNVGQREEEVFVKSLTQIGFKLVNTTTDQNVVKISAHVTGFPDGEIIDGPSEYKDKLPSIAEFKTHSEKSFRDLVKSGVKKAKLEHYVQMQLYMYARSYRWCLYMAVNKNTSEYYCEWVEGDPYYASSIVDRLEAIATSGWMPKGISEDPDFYQCKYCSAYSICFGSKVTKCINCRTCGNSVPLKDKNAFFCMPRDKEIPSDIEFREGRCHSIHPDLIPLVQVHPGVYVRPNGTEVVNGANGMPSRALIEEIENEYNS